jgi:hypothetical protein
MFSSCRLKFVHEKATMSHFKNQFAHFEDVIHRCKMLMKLTRSADWKAMVKTNPAAMDAIFKAYLE